ncbi:MAG: hypothetical protein ACR2Q3_04260 [Woeseiaceae bacterium]
MSDEINKPPRSFYWIAGVGLAWNVVGLLAYLSQMTMSPEALAQLAEPQRAFMETRPMWASSAFAIAVNAGVIGCLLLLLRQSAARLVLIISLAAVMVQNIHAYGMSNGMEVFGIAGVASAAAILGIGAYLVKMATDAKQAGWLN